jgi:hypothetical protein
MSMAKPEGNLDPDVAARIEEINRRSRRLHLIRTWSRWLGVLGVMYGIVLIIWRPAWDAYTCIYAVTLFLDLLASAQAITFASWKEATGRARVDAIGLGVLASLATIWSVLCLMGIVRY